jgi:hypothetical protein
MSVLFHVNKADKTVFFAGRQPETVGTTITGFKDMPYAEIMDLGYLGLPNEGFLTEQDALTAGIPASEVQRMKDLAYELEWTRFSEQRETLITAVRWRTDRHNDEIALDREPSEDITPVLNYIQALRDLTTAFTDPFEIVWPQVPALPTA